MKRHIIVGAAVGTTVFGAVLGLAAGLDVSSGDKLGSGQATVTSCDTDGVTTSYVFDGATDVTAVQVEGISDNCADATVSVALSHHTSLNMGGGEVMASASGFLETYLDDGTQTDNRISLPLTTPVNAQLFDTVTVTLHGGHPAYMSNQG